MSPKPVGQRVLAELWVRPSWWLRGVTVEVDGLERIPVDRPVVIAMNHTDRYNYFGLQTALHRRGSYVSTWVKGKYYRHPLTAAFMRLTSNIPVPSRGFLIATRFEAHHHRVPTAPEYRQLRDLADGKPVAEPLPAVAALVPDPAAWCAQIEADFAPLADDVVALSRRALALGLHVQVFPEGTRSVTLGPGRTGAAQLAQHLGVPILPIGCSGSHRVYTGDLPWPSPGTIRYRVGPLLEPDGPELAQFRVTAPFAPLTRSASLAHGPSFRAITDCVMQHISELIDPEHQPRPPSQQVDAGAERFV